MVWNFFAWAQVSIVHHENNINCKTNWWHILPKLGSSHNYWNKKSLPAGSSKNKSKNPIIVDVDMRFLIMLPESLLILLTISWYTFIKKL